MSRLSIENALTDFRRLDLLALQDSPVHRLDARAKVLATLLFIIAVMSYSRYELSALLPLSLFPVSLAIRGNLPAAYLLKRIAPVLPFAVLVGLFNPLLDRQVMLRLGTFPVSGGWLSCSSIVVRALLTATAALVLVSCTGFNAICHALNQLGFPRAFTTQLLFLYRYLFVLIEEARQVSRARELRSCDGKGLGIRNSGSLLGNLLLRTWERAERIHLAMLSRGFAGDFPLRGTTAFGWREMAFLSGWAALFLALRTWNVSDLLGRLCTGLIP